MLRKIFLVLGICFSLAACQTLSGGTGANDKFSPEALSQNLKAGITTPEEVLAIYGKPEYTSQDANGPRIWNYNVDDTTNSIIGQAVSFIPVFGVDTTANQMKRNRSLSIFFYQNKVENYTLDE